MKFLDGGILKLRAIPRTPSVIARTSTTAAVDGSSQLNVVGQT